MIEAKLDKVVKVAKEAHDLFDEYKPPRRDVLKGLAAVAVSAIGFDMATRPTLEQGFKPVSYPDAGNVRGSTLSVFHRGLNAEVREQTEQIVESALGYGGLLQIDSHGERYSPRLLAEYSATKIEEELKKHGRDHVIFTALSMGSIVAKQTIETLQSNGTDRDLSVKLHMTAVDAPTSYDDIDPSSKIGRAAKYIPSGALSNYVVKQLFPDLKSSSYSHLIDELRSIDQPPVVAQSFGPDSFVFWRSLRDNLVDGASAEAHWLESLKTDVPHEEISVDMLHAGLNTEPDRARIAFRNATDYHLAS